MNKSLALESCAEIIRHKKYIDQYKQQEFPSGCHVMVDCDTYKGPGIVSFYNSDIPPEKIPVKLENGNVWYYPFEKCERIKYV